MRLERLLRPKTIAAIGGRYAEAVIEQCAKAGFEGPVWPVHPIREEIAGRPCFPSIEALPVAPDATFIGIGREPTVEAVRVLRRYGAGGAVAFAAGFKETGVEGARLQEALVEAAGPMPVLGPNCYGFIDYLDGALLWPDQHGGQRCPRGVALVVQSSNVAINLTMQRRGLPIAFVVTLGNQAMVGLAEIIEALSAEPRVSAIGLYIEGLGDPGAFQATVRRARAAGTPVVALKIGRSPAGERTALTHTASLAGGDAVADAFFRRQGVPRVHSLEALLESLKLLHLHGPLAGNQVVSLSCSGGEAALTADAAHGRALDLRPFEPDEAQAVAATVHPLVHIANPFDYHTFDWARPERLRATFEAVMRARFDLAALVIDLPRDDRCDPASWWMTIDAWRIAARATGQRSALISSLPECLPESAAERFMEAGIAPLHGLEDALAAIEAAACAGAPVQDDAFFGQGLVRRLPVRTLDEADAKRRLAESGLAVPDGRVVTTVDQARDALAELGPPLALKLIGAGFAHKTEQAALRLGLRDAGAVGSAAAELLARGERLLVERMVEGGVAELIVGIARDPVLGLHLVLGAGGVLAELVADRVVLLLPSSAEEVRTAIGSLRVARLLAGFRGQPPGDLEAAVQAVLAIQRFALDHLQALEELDVNPLIVRPEGAVAVDALIRIREA